MAARAKPGTGKGGCAVEADGRGVPTARGLGQTHPDAPSAMCAPQVSCLSVTYEIGEGQSGFGRNFLLAGRAFPKSEVFF